ncbi:solute carrier family member bloated tubules [Arctopsyche grandis]|uniref:solute carrier family member bloated tubules n=1 Tax=Arctopsyche grandis TaxID=121162 RepID=UPI00406D96C9
MNQFHCTTNNAQDTARDPNYGDERPAVVRSILCSVCVAVGLATTARLPREVAAHGGAAFMVAYTLLSIAFTLPLVFLELALGKFSEQGAIKLWRSVPLLKGLGYVKLFASFLVAVYYMVYVGLVCALLIWTAKGPVPLAECRELHRALDGYQVVGTPGQKCIYETFLKPVVDDPMWYGIVAAIVFTLWLLVSLCLIRLPQTFLMSLYVFGSAILVLSMTIVIMDDLKSVKMFFFDVNWELLTAKELWYAAFVQSLFSMHLGFGYHVTTGGTVYNKSCLFRSALWFTLWNILCGWLSVLLWHSIEDTKKPKDTSILMTLILIYDSSLSKDASAVKFSFAYTLLICSGFISVLSLTYPVVWCISLEDCYHKRSVGWLVSITGIFCSLSIFVLGLDVIVLLDSFVIPIYLLTFMALELFGLFYIYGFKYMKHDLEFILNHKINYFLIFLWMIMPIALSGMICWQIWKHFNDWSGSSWTFWLMIGMFIFSLLHITIWAVWVITHKEGYGIMQKLISACKSSRKWGPVEFKLRYKWLHYKSTKKRSKAWKLDCKEPMCSNCIVASNKPSDLYLDSDKHSTNNSIQKILWVTEYETAKPSNLTTDLHAMEPNISCLVRHSRKTKCSKHCGHVCWKESGF